VLVYPARRKDENLEYLLLRRIRSRGGVWQGVTGRVEEDEEVSAAARRELAEETGLNLLILKDLLFSFTYRVKDEWRYLYLDDVEKITVFAFAALVKTGQDPILDPDEHDRWIWCGTEEAFNLIDWPDSREALRRCDRVLSSLER
jgi:dATP pyrophosphohydrolase